MLRDRWKMTAGIEKFTILDFPVSEKDQEKLMAVPRTFTASTVRCAN